PCFAAFGPRFRSLDFEVRSSMFNVRCSPGSFSLLPAPFSRLPPPRGGDCHDLLKPRLILQKIIVVDRNKRQRLPPREVLRVPHEPPPPVQITRHVFLRDLRGSARDLPRQLHARLPHRHKALRHPKRPRVKRHPVAHEFRRHAPRRLVEQPPQLIAHL